MLPAYLLLSSSGFLLFLRHLQTSGPPHPEPCPAISSLPAPACLPRSGCSCPPNNGQQNNQQCVYLVTSSGTYQQQTFNNDCQVGPKTTNNLYLQQR